MSINRSEGNPSSPQYKWVSPPSIYECQIPELGTYKVPSVQAPNESGEMRTFIHNTNFTANLRNPEVVLVLANGLAEKSLKQGVSVIFGPPIDRLRRGADEIKIIESDQEIGIYTDVDLLTSMFENPPEQDVSEDQIMQRTLYLIRSLPIVPEEGKV